MLGRRGSGLEQVHGKGKIGRRTHAPSGTTHSLHASSFQAPLVALLTYMSSTYHFFTALGSLIAHKATSMSLFPSQHPSHLFRAKACAASLPSLACLSTNQGNHIILHPTDKFLDHQKLSSSLGEELLPCL